MARLPKPRFNLKSPKAKSESLIFLVFRYRGKRLLYSTSLRVSPKEWNFKAQRPFNKEQRPDLWAIHSQLDDLAAYCHAIYIESGYGRISVVDFKSELSKRTGKDKPEYKPSSFFDFVDQEIVVMQEEGMLKRSLTPYKLHANILKKFAEENNTFSFDDVDWDFRLKLIDWLTKRGVLLAYGNKTLSILRQFLERARRKNLHENVKYHGKGWYVPKKKATGPKVILTPVELQKLADLELYGIDAKVRDLFLIGAGTGQRFSDYSKYTPDNFYKTLNGTPLLSLISQKTDTPAKIPLNLFPWLIPTLEKYDYHSPKISMQKLNENIKTICDLAGIHGRILKVEQYMGRKARVETSYTPKYLEVSSHTCRRSFATNLYRMGFQLSQIMPMTGHSTEAQLREYIGIDAEENAEAVAKSIKQRNINSSF